MKKISFMLAAAIFFAAVPVSSAPVFLDASGTHWAGDAVANLTDAGFIEGYPDGTFKGDRSSTRYELAMAVARFLAKNDQSHALFASRTEFARIRELTNTLKPELDALGVKITDLERSVSSLDERTEELEKITFYGELDVNFTTQGFTSGNAQRAWNGSAWVESSSRYMSDAGSVSGANIHPVTDGVFPTMNYTTGRPLTNGTGVSAAATLGITAKISEDIDAGLELAAYSAVGSPIVNSFYGVKQPYMSNIFAGQANYSSTAVTGTADTLLTSASLDKFWIKHRPSGIMLTVGSFGDVEADPILFAGQPNPNLSGTSFIDNYGVKINGSARVFSEMDWEIFYTSLPDANISYDSAADIGSVSPTGCNTYAYSMTLGWKFKGGNFKMGYLRAINDGTNDSGFGISGVINSGYMDSSPMLLWVNPSEYRFSTSGAAPVSGGSFGIDSYGPQSTSNWSVHADYAWDDLKLKPRLFAEYAFSNYKPNMSSDFSKNGDAFRAGAGISLFSDSLDFDAIYKSVDAFYDPFTLRCPVQTYSMWRLPNFSYYPNMYQLHDSDEYTNNREGWEFKLSYRFKDDRGRAWVSYQNYDQFLTSSYCTADYGVFGFFPGFIDSVFTAYSNLTYVGYDEQTVNVILPDGTSTAMTLPSSYALLEDIKGRTDKIEAGISYNFNNSLSTDLSYYRQHFERDTSLSVNEVRYVPLAGVNHYTGAAAAANYINFDVTGFHIGLQYPFNEKFTGRIGYDYTSMKGHYDPGLLYERYALATGSMDYENLNTKQSAPYVGFDCRLSNNTEWGLNLQFFDTSDGAELLNPYPSQNETALNPYSWDGTQLTTEFKVKF